MAGKAIDYERDYDPARPGYGGVIIGTHKVLNMDVFMYRNDPGIYLNAYGKRVPPSMAEAAGFEVKRWENERKKKAAMNSFKASQEASEAAESNEEGWKIIAEHEGFKLIELPMDRATILDPEGNPTFPPNSISVVKEAFESMYRALESDYEEQIALENPKPEPAKATRRSAAKAE